MQGVERRDRKLLTLGEVAEQIGRCKMTIRRWIKSGELKASRVGSHGRFYIAQEDLDECLKYTPKKTDGGHS